MKKYQSNTPNFLEVTQLSRVGSLQSMLTSQQLTPLDRSPNQKSSSGYQHNLPQIDRDVMQALQPQLNRLLYKQTAKALGTNNLSSVMLNYLPSTNLKINNDTSAEEDEGQSSSDESDVNKSKVHNSKNERRFLTQIKVTTLGPQEERNQQAQNVSQHQDKENKAFFLLDSPHNINSTEDINPNKKSSIFSLIEKKQEQSKIRILESLNLSYFKCERFFCKRVLNSG